MRLFPVLGLASAALAFTGPLAAQADSTWHLAGLRTGFCIQLLLDPASEILQALPSGTRFLPASEDKSLHPSLRDVVASQSEFGAWAPSQLCFHAVDTISTSEFTIRGKRDRPQLFGFWTVKSPGTGGGPRDLVLALYTTSGRLAKAGEKLVSRVREGRLRMGKVPTVDEDGVPSSDDRFEVKLGKTLITWDGRLANDTVRVKEPVTMDWALRDRGARLSLSPEFALPMVGALKVDGKDDFAKALKASPTRFAGPAYRGGTGMVSFGP